jgi:hypothetical protein
MTRETRGRPQSLGRCDHGAASKESRVASTTKDWSSSEGDTSLNNTHQLQTSIHGENLTTALKALISFMKDDPMQIPPGVLEAAGESPMDGEQPEDRSNLIDNRRGKQRCGGAGECPILSGPLDTEDGAMETATGEAPTKMMGLDDSAYQGDAEDGASTTAASKYEIVDENGVLSFDDEEAIEVDVVAAKTRTKRAILISKELQRRKTSIDVDDLIALVQSPLCAVVRRTIMKDRQACSSKPRCIFSFLSNWRVDFLR